MRTFNLIYIKNRRKELQISLQEMAVSLGFKNASTYMKYERGDYSFKAEHLPLLAKELNCKIENFFSLNVVKTATKRKRKAN
ncbi:helix-turn-helix transcriptional regulator [Paenalkalicoccus suaedae]|uniref:Helix-turn-helix transcriptional regulator n=1 Tax=Paenalkalicoccus suaedae TaxID=2592382 RepID=A0A859FB34_9BACI|nr:helix-turn-helix transcriptional regulator [Paenalkalicoccus suaedae]QKS70217.1 helix-turn-helix transcriptional regulator [Paenalkalicoccus suaedae]